LNKLLLRLEFFFFSNSVSPYFGLFYDCLRLNFGVVQLFAGILGKNEFTRYDTND